MASDSCPDDAVLDVAFILPLFPLVSPTPRAVASKVGAGECEDCQLADTLQSPPSQFLMRSSKLSPGILCLNHTAAVSPLPVPIFLRVAPWSVINSGEEVSSCRGLQDAVYSVVCNPWRILSLASDVETYLVGCPCGAPPTHWQP